MDNVINAIKQHPVAVGGGVIVLLLLMKMGGNSSGGNGDIMGATLRSQEIATAGNVQIAGINANAAATRSAMAADMFKTAAGVAANRDDNDSALAASRYTSMLGYLTQSQAISAQSEIMSQEIRAGVDVAKTSIAAQSSILAMQANNDYSLALKNLEIGAEQLPSIMQHQETMASLLGDTNINLAKIYTEADLTRAHADRAAVDGKNNQGLLDSAVEIVGMVIGGF